MAPKVKAVSSARALPTRRRSSSSSPAPKAKASAAPLSPTPRVSASTSASPRPRHLVKERAIATLPVSKVKAKGIDQSPALTKPPASHAVGAGGYAGHVVGNEGQSAPSRAIISRQTITEIIQDDFTIGIQVEDEDLAFGTVSPRTLVDPVGFSTRETREHSQTLDTVLVHMLDGSTFEISFDDDTGPVPLCIDAKRAILQVTGISVCEQLLSSSDIVLADFDVAPSDIFLAVGSDCMRVAREYIISQQGSLLKWSSVQLRPVINPLSLEQLCHAAHQAWNIQQGPDSQPSHPALSNALALSSVRDYVSRTVKEDIAHARAERMYSAVTDPYEAETLNLQSGQFPTKVMADYYERGWSDDHSCTSVVTPAMEIENKFREFIASRNLNGSESKCNSMDWTDVCVHYGARAIRTVDFAVTAARERELRLQALVLDGQGICVGSKCTNVANLKPDIRSDVSSGNLSRQRYLTDEEFDMAYERLRSSIEVS